MLTSLYVELFAFFLKLNLSFIDIINVKPSCSSLIRSREKLVLFIADRFDIHDITCGAYGCRRLCATFTYDVVCVDRSYVRSEAE